MSKANTVVRFPEKQGADEWHIAQAKRFQPRNLTRDEKREWLLVCVELSKMGRLRAAFIPSIRDMVVISVRIRKMTSWLNENGWTYENTGRHGDNVKMNPKAAQINVDIKTVTALRDRFGLSPLADKRLASQQGQTKGNPFATLDED